MPRKKQAVTHLFKVKACACIPILIISQQLLREPYKLKGELFNCFRNKVVTSQQQRLFLFHQGLLSGKAERKS